MLHGIKYLIVSLVFSHLGFWSGNLFLIAPFSDLCLLVPFSTGFSGIIENIKIIGTKCKISSYERVCLYIRELSEDLRLILF